MDARFCKHCVVVEREGKSCLGKVSVIDRFSNDCRTIKTKAITSDQSQQERTAR